MMNVDGRDLPPSNLLEGLRVLLVEDQTVIAMDAEAMLMEMGAASVVTASSSEEAMRYILTSPPDFAVLDVGLGSDTSLNVAEELFRRKTPFIFATGYGAATMLPASMRSIPVAGKPYDPRALLNAIAAVENLGSNEDGDCRT
jgi:DNA-binding NtrC family response regulator